ncbi:MAG: type II toxin-antitoxin system VapC family toxin [Opitutales bacterium]|nr:type II toxin-antitoxin system VapC family toxin [Opitutales bacterium]MCH8541334.1 type II toxin-antitoxin system VapC family toxin [Opitutales bacterium]
MLIDTDILIDYFKEIPAAVEFVETYPDQIFISAISVAELYQGVRDGEERTALDDFLSAVGVLATNASIAQTAGLFRRQYRSSHNPGLADCLIAATAEAHCLPLKTLNTKHFPMLTEVEAPYRKP